MATDDGDVILVEIAGHPHEGGRRRPPRRARQPGWRPERRRLGPGRRRVHHQQRRLLQLRRRDGPHDPGRGAADLEGRLDPAGRPRHRRGHHALHGVVDGRCCAPNDLVFDGHGGFWFTDHGGAPRRATATAPGSTTPRPTARAMRGGDLPARRPNGIGLSPTGHPPLRGRDPQRTGSGGPLGSGRGGGDAGRPRWAPASPACPASASSTAWPSTATATCAWPRSSTAASRSSAPTARRSSTARCPTALVTNICFGGADLRTAFVTRRGTGRLLSPCWPGPGPASACPRPATAV